MEELDGWKEWIGKRVFVNLESGRTYTGTVQYILSGTEPAMTLIDKFGKKVRFRVSEIEVIQEEAK